MVNTHKHGKHIVKFGIVDPIALLTLYGKLWQVIPFRVSVGRRYASHNDLISEPLLGEMLLDAAAKGGDRMIWDMMGL